MRIACGTDFSRSAGEAARAAAALTRCLGAELWLVHVVEAANQEPADSTAATVNTSHQLGALADDLGSELSTRPIVSVIEARRASDALTALADAKEASLLIVGSQGHRSSSLVRLGGTSERIAATSRVPVLVVREAAPFEAWARTGRPLRIVAGLDLDSSSSPAIQFVETLHRARPCHIVLAHVYYPDEAANRHAVASSFKTARDIEQQVARDLRATVGDLAREANVEFRPKAGVGRLGDHLLEVAEAENADLVVVGSHHKRGIRRLSSVSSVVLHWGRASVACIPAAMDDDHRNGSSEPVSGRRLS